jgi:acyl carrier protein phosphodiesterase
MNFLAHAYLSFGDPQVLVGNMIGDFVKGTLILEKYPAGVQWGIRLHRAIDSFTDHHPATRTAGSFFRDHYGLYSSIFTDIAYDHFLANDSDHFPAGTLQRFAGETYQTLNRYPDWLPPRFRQMLYYMQSQDWLYGYRQTKGVQQAFNGIVRRARYINDATPAFRDFEEHYAALESLYRQFFPGLEAFIADYRGQHPLPEFST